MGLLYDEKKPKQEKPKQFSVGLRARWETRDWENEEPAIELILTDGIGGCCQIDSWLNEEQHEQFEKLKQSILKNRQIQAKLRGMLR